MINSSLLSSIFDNYGINKITVVEDNSALNFIISDMPSSISLERWEYLENILKEVTKKEIVFITKEQASSIFSGSTIKEGVVIK